MSPRPTVIEKANRACNQCPYRGEFGVGSLDRTKQGDRVKIRLVQHVSILWLCALLTACAAPYRTPKMNPEVSDFPGIYDALRIPKTTSVDVILVHGMCTHKEDWVTNTNKELAEALNMKLDNIGPPIPLGDSSTPDQSSHEAQLYTARMTGFGLTVNTFSIVWSPISDDAKRVLCYDVSGGNARARVR
jgi:hypothetical protein